MENYDLFGDDLGSGMLDTLAELGSDNFGTAAQQQSSASQRLGPSSTEQAIMQNFGNAPPSYTQIGQGLDQSAANKMNPNPGGYPDYSAQYAQYAAAGQAGLGAYGVPPSSQTPSRPMPGYPPYHQSQGPSPNVHYQDYSVQSSGMMRPTPREVPPPSQPLVPPSNRMPGPGGPSHMQQQQFPGYRGPSQDLYAQQVHRWNEQQSYAGTVPHHYPPNAASGYRQPHAYTPNIPRPPQQQSAPPQSQQQQSQQQTGPHSMSPYMTRPQGPTSVMPQGYPSMYANSAQQYPDYHASSSRVNVPPSATPTYGSAHHPQQYASLPSQHPQYGTSYGQYYAGQGQAQGQGLSSSGPTPGNGPMSSSYPSGYTSGLPHGSPSVPNGSPGYRPPGPGYAQLPQLSPRQPTPSPRPPAPSPRPSAPSTPTIPMSPAQSMSQQQQQVLSGPGPMSGAGHSSISSLQQLEQMVMPHVSKNSPSPKPHLTSTGVMSPMSGPKTPMSPGMIGPKTPMSPTQWPAPPMSRSSNKQQQPCYPQHIQQPHTSPGTLHGSISGPVTHSPLSSAHVMDTSLGGPGRCQDSSDLDQLTSTLDTSAPEAANPDEIVKPSPPFQTAGDLNSMNSACTPLAPEPSGALSVSENSNEALSNLMSGSAGAGSALEESAARFQHTNASSATSRPTNTTTESPSLESDNTNLGNLGSNLENSQHSQNSSSGDGQSQQQQAGTSPKGPPVGPSNTLGGSGPGSNSSVQNQGGDFGGALQQQQPPLGINSHASLGSLSTSGSSSPLPSMMAGGLSHGGVAMSPLSHLQAGPSAMMGYGASPGSSHQAGGYGANGPNRNMTNPSPMPPNQGGASGPPLHYPVFSGSNAGGSDLGGSGPPPQGYYHTGTGYPPSPYQPSGMHPGMRPPGQHVMPPMGHGGPMGAQLPAEALQFEIHQVQSQLQHLYSTPPTQQTQMQIAELQDRLRGLQQQASRGPYPGMGHPSMGQHGVPSMYGQGHPGHGMEMGMDFPGDVADDFQPKGKKKKERKPKEPKGGKGKGKGKKEPPMPEFDLMGQQPPPPPFGVGVPPMPMSHEIYDFQDIPPEIPEKKPKKPRKPREAKSPKEKKTKDPKPVKEKSPKKSRSKKKPLLSEESPVSFHAPADSFSMDSSSLLIKSEDTFESDQKNGIGAAGITAAEGGLTTPIGVCGEVDASTQDNVVSIMDASSPVTAPSDALSTDPLPEELSSPAKSPKKKSKPKMKSSSSSKKRPTKTTLIASLAAKKKKKKKGSDSEGCSDLDATPPPSPPPEEDATNVREESLWRTRHGIGWEDDDDSSKRRSGRHRDRKKYIEDVLACLSDEDLIVPPVGKQSSASPTKSLEPTTPRPAGSETPVQSGTTPGNVTPIASSSTPTPLCTADDSNSQGPTKPNFVFVNPAEEDTMIIQHILTSRMGKRDIVAESTDDEEEEEDKKEAVKPKDETEETTKSASEIAETPEFKIEPAAEPAESEETKVEAKVETEPKVESEEAGDSSDSKKSKSEPKPKKKRERVLETVEVEEYYVKYKNFSYLHCEWKTEEELTKGDKRAVPKIRRFKQKMNQRDVFEFLEEDPFNPEYVEVDRILDKSEVRDPATGNITKNYLVKWRALPYDECTWELADDIDPEKLKQFHAFYSPPPRELWKPKRRPKAADWVKLEESPIYKNSNTLRAYQLEGLNWLSFSWYNGRNCILADEMGLGKTIQSLTFVDSVHRLGIRGPFLIIAPLSTVPNWQREFETWTDLNVVVYHGSVPSRNMIQEYELFYRHPDNPQMNIKDVYKFNVMITTFEIVLTDVLDLKDFPWRLCIIDEAHRLKNKNCKLLEGLRLLNLEHRVLLSGTPLQNNINELFSLLNFLEPTQFSSDENFKKEFGELTTETQVQKLQALLKPMMLRRLKEDVEKSIAPKEETIVEVELTNMQKKYYRGILEKNFSFLSKGTSAANIPNLMNTMMELRKCCIHPYLLNGAEEEIQRDYRLVNGGPDDNDLYYKALVSSSGKMVLVDKLLPKLKANGHRVLIFSQMVRCLDILEDYLIYMKYPFERIDGRIRGPFRQAAIDRFSKPDSDRFVFLLCTKAGGLGINLTAADTVIIYDSDWNPQNDLQAQARCHRIGQAKMVKVYRLICRSTYEREMFDRASLKLGLDKAVLQSMNTSQGSSGKGFDTSANKQLSKKEVEDLLKKGAYGALMDEDNAGDKFCEEDIDCILSRRTQVITLETGEKGSTFSKASFASTGIREDINLDDPDFWTKWAKKAEIEMDEMGQKNELVIHEPRRRTQIKRYGHDEAMMEISELSSTSDSDEDGNIGERTRGRGGKRGRGKRQRSRRGMDDDFHVDDGVVEYGRWSRSECYKIERGLLTFGWARWKDILNFGQFRIGWGERDIEDCARIILVHCVNNFRGDEKVRSFVQDLIFPGDGAGKVTRSHLGLANPVSRGGRKSRKKGREPNTSPEPPVEWLKDEKYDPDLHLDNNYKKHIGKHSNKVLLRIRMLYYIKQEIVAEYASKIATNAPISEIQIIPLTLAMDIGPVPWWDRDADTALLIGTYRHGYERYNMMRMDPNLCFLARCGPPDGSAVLAEISSEVNEEDMDKVGGDEDDDESCLDSVSEKQPPSVGSGVAAAEAGESGKYMWPNGTDLNTRLRKLITAFQRNFKKEEVRNAQKAKRLERKEKIDQIVREREKQKLEVYQKRWSKKEEADFFRTVSSYGIQYNRKEKRYDWSKFRAISRLDKKFDETLTEYYRAFYAMCKRISGKKLSEEEDLIQVPVEPVTEERARRTLERIDLLNKIREEIIYHSQLDEKLKLCQASLDMPDWWIPGRHDKDLLLGAARHGLGRTDVFYLNDPDLSFREILRRHIAGEPLVDSTEKSKKSDKKSKGEGGKRDMVDIEIKDIKQERADQKQRQREADEAAENEAKETERKEAEAEEEKEKGVGQDDEKGEEVTQKSPEEVIGQSEEVVIKKEVIDESEEEMNKEGKSEEKMEVDEEASMKHSDGADEADMKLKHEVESDGGKEEEEPSSKRRKLNEDASKCAADYSSKGKRDDEESTKSSGSELNEVQVEIKDEFKITIKLPAEKMKKVEVQVKGSPKFSVPEPPAPPAQTHHFPPDEITLQQMKLLLNPENLSGDNLEALGNLMNQMNPIRWPRDRAIQIRLEHVVHAVEKGEWPVSRFFTSAGLADMFEYTPQGTPDAATPARDTPTPISECSDLAPPEDLIMTLPPAATTTPTPAAVPGRRGRRRRIAIDVETERAKLQALLNHGLHNSNLLPQMQRLSSLRGNAGNSAAQQSSQGMDKEDSSEGEAPPSRSHSKFQPPPAHQHHSNITSSLLRSSHQKAQQQQQQMQQRSSPSPRFSPQLQQQSQQQGSTLDLSFKPTDRNSIAAAAMSALSSLSSVTVTPVTLQSPSSNSNNNNSALDLSSTRVSNSRRERERGGREPGRATPQMLMPEKRREPTPEASPSERPKQSKLEDMLDKLRKRTLGDEAETTPLPVEKEKRRKKLDEIVLGLSASKGHSSMFSPPPARGTRGSSPASSTSTNRLQSPPMNISAAASAAAAAHHQNAKDIATSQANMFNNSLLSATLSLFNSAAGKEFSRQLAGQAASASLGKGKEGLQRANLPGPSPLAEMPKCDFSRLAELAVPKFDLFSQDAKVNKWLAEHANLTPERPVSPELLDGRRRRRPRVDPMLLDWNKLSGDENVTVINRITGKKITGPKAPQLKHLGHWLSENPAFDVDPRWSDLVREKGNLPSDLIRRVPGGGGGGGGSGGGGSAMGGGGGGAEKKKGPGRPPMISSQQPVNTPTSNSASIPTSSANAYNSLGAFSSLPGLSGLNPNLLASLPLGSLDPKNPLFMPFGGLGSLGGLGNLGSLGSLGSLGNLSSLGLSSSLFGFGFPGMEMGGEKAPKEAGHSSGGGGASQSTSSGKKDEKKQKGGGASSAALASQNMLSSALPFLFPNPGLMYNPLGLGSFPLGGGMNPSSFGSMGGGMPNGMGGAMGSSGSGTGKKGKGGGANLGLAGLAGLNIPSLLKKEGQAEKGGSRGKHSPAAAGAPPMSAQATAGPSQGTPPSAPQQNPEDSDDESMKSLMGNHADDLPDEDSPSENAERIVLKESKELEKELAQQKMETRRERRVRDRSSLLADAPRGGLTAAERQLLMVKKKERLAKEDSNPPRESSGRTTRRSAAAASRSRLEDAVSKMRNSDQSGDN